MPTTPLRNLLYRAALPLAPSPKGQMRHQTEGHAIDLPAYERLLIRHHVLGSSLLLSDGSHQAIVHTSVARPDHRAGTGTLYRVASITKMATALVTLMLCDDGAFSLDTPVSFLLPDGGKAAALEGVTLRHLLCHTSGLRDIPAYNRALREGKTFHGVLSQPDVRVGKPGEAMVYCNLGFGLLGCVLEHAAGLSIEALFRERLFGPLGMRATLDASTLREEDMMPISRVLPYRPGQDVTITALGRCPLGDPDPLRHFGHTAGAMYTDCPSLLRLLHLIAGGGEAGGKRLLSPKAIAEMTTQQSFCGPAARPTRRYGLGLVLLHREDISPRPLMGHQGFAYGCVDGAFIEPETGRAMVFLNGGASEAREGRLGLCNRDLLRWALGRELPQWT